MARINLTLSDDEQTKICLACELPDCIDIECRDCPIQVEQRRIWREKTQLRKNAAVLSYLSGASQREGEETPP